MNCNQKVKKVPQHTEAVCCGYEAENGPDVWARLSPEYQLCGAGIHQSPIDIVNPSPAKLPPITFNYQPTSFKEAGLRLMERNTTFWNFTSMHPANIRSCSEGVKWFVLTTPIEMSESQIAAFKSIMSCNTRPVRPLNGRELLVDTTHE